MKICPYCAEEIKEEAIKCKHCQSDLTVSNDTISATSEPSHVEVRRNKFTQLIVALIIVAVLATAIVVGFRDTSGPTTVVGSFMIELKGDNIGSARKLLSSDFSKSITDSSLRDMGKKMKDEAWLADPSSIIINDDYAAEDIIYVRNGKFGHVTVRLKKSFWGWKITGIH